MSNYKSKTPEEAFERSQAAHVKSATLQAFDRHPEVIVAVSITIVSMNCSRRLVGSFL